MTNKPITVGLQEINQGKRYVSESCPVALAFKREGYDYVTVDPFDKIIVLDGNDYRMAEALYEWTTMFDRGKLVSPIKLMIEANFVEIAEYLD